MNPLSELLAKCPGLAVVFPLGMGRWIGGIRRVGATGSLVAGIGFGSRPASPPRCRFRAVAAGREWKGIFRSWRRISFVRALGRPAMIALALAAAACSRSPEPPKSTAPATGEWREFEGSWNAAGSRRTISLGADRRGSNIDLRGAMLLSGAGRPGIGFRSDLIALVDSETGLIGRSVWTDENGDQVFSELKGEGTAAKNHITGTILGGTGRYAGVTGTYEFTWRYVIETEDGSIQGSAVGLKGRFRTGQSSEGGAKP